MRAFVWVIAITGTVLTVVAFAISNYFYKQSYEANAEYADGLELLVQASEEVISSYKETLNAKNSLIKALDDVIDAKDALLRLHERIAVSPGVVLPERWEG